MISYRNMHAHDLPGGLELCRLAGWNQLEDDWLTFLHANPHGCFVAVENGRIVGTVTSVRYEDRFAWVGMVLVHPEYRRQGIGSSLLNKAIDSLVDIPCVKLDATPAGREVYLKKGFRDEYTLSRMVCGERVSAKPSGFARPMAEADLPGLLERDKMVFGADRALVLEHYYRSRPEFALMSHDQQGYCFGRQGHLYNHIGPVVANNFEAAKSLFEAVLQYYGQKPVVTDITHFSAEWNEWLPTLGFVEQRRFIRMFKGENNFPGMPAHQYSIGGPEFG